MPDFFSSLFPPAQVRLPSPRKELKAGHETETDSGIRHCCPRGHNNATAAAARRSPYLHVWQRKSCYRECAIYICYSAPRFILSSHGEEEEDFFSFFPGALPRERKREKKKKKKKVRLTRHLPPHFFLSPSPTTDVDSSFFLLTPSSFFLLFGSEGSAEEAWRERRENFFQGRIRNGDLESN